MTEPVRTIGGDPVIPGVDLAGLAMRTLALASSLGAACECVVLWETRMLTVNAPPSNTPDVGTAFYVLVFGTAASMAAAGGTAWAFLAPVGSPWRRAALSAIAAFATLVAAAAAVPIDANLGPMALLAAAALFGAAAFVAGRKVFAWFRDLP